MRVFPSKKSPGRGLAMKMDLRVLCIAAFFTLPACGPQRTSSAVLETTSDECVGEALPNQFMVQFKNGESAVINAESEQEFTDGYLTKNSERVKVAEHNVTVHTWD